MTSDGQRPEGGSRRLRFATDDRLVGLLRGGDTTAFEILYDRHARELLAFCRYTLGSQQDAEDAVQATFAAAYTALLADQRRVDVRPWLYAIARNRCLGVLRQRGAVGDLTAPLPSPHDPVARAELREDLRQVLANVLELPEHQRAALILAEVHGLSQDEIGRLLGLRAGQVKANIFQARSNLLSERRAREADCGDIREELEIARGAALLKSRLRRHLRSCEGCREYAEQISNRRQGLRVLIPVLPLLVLKRCVLRAVFSKASRAGADAGRAAGAPGGGATAQLAGGTSTTLAVKVLAGIALIGVGTGVDTQLLNTPTQRHAPVLATARAHAPGSHRLAAFVTPAPATASPPRADVHAVGTRAGGAVHLAPDLATSTVTPITQASVQVLHSGGGAATASSVNPRSATGEEHPGERVTEEPHGKSEEAHGKSEEAHGKSEEAHGKSVEAAHGKSEEAHGKSEEAHGKSEEAAAHGKSEEAHGKSEEAHGKSEEAHGKSEEAHGKSEEAHGKSEEAHGKSEEAAHGKSEEAHGKA